MKHNGFGVTELVITIGVFTIAYFITANILSYNYSVNFKEESYNIKINAIETQATIYAKNNKSLFKNENTVYLTIDDLAKANVVISNNDGIVVDPRNSDKGLNELKVKIVKDEDTFTAKVIG